MKISIRLKKLKKEQVLIVVYVVIILAGLIKTYFDEQLSVVTTFSMPVNKKVIVIDAGHGGWDPGMIGLDGTSEKDINLLIAEKLQAYLEMGGSTAIVTRSEDEAAGSTKREDLKNRKELANTSKADLFISIHQNSYPQQNVKGAQTFYYETSDDSKRLAEFIQEQIQIFLDKDNKRVAKANTDYYVLKKSEMPAVIVECGFLSNPSENKSLSIDEYQEKVAWTIYMGIINYFGKNIN